MKTAMQLLIEELKDSRMDCLPEFEKGISHAILLASSLREKEKHQIIDAYETGLSDCNNNFENDGNIYFKNTYNEPKN